MNAPENNNQICKSPFYMAEISENGNVYPCCPRYINFYSFGNIFEQPFDKIWNSEKAKIFRNKILNNDYSLCNKNICVYNVTLNKQEITENMPCRYLRLAYDTSCNVACKTCRDFIKTGNKETNEKVMQNIIPVLKDVEIIQLMLTGDVFASNHGKNLISYISENYPNIKFNIDTNGILLDEKLFEKLKLQGKINKINISIPGIKKKTYDKIVVNGNFEKLMKNVNFLAKDTSLDMLIVMVVHAVNYKEMPLMSDFVKSIGAKVLFTVYQPWEGTEFSKRYKELAIFEEDSKKHKSFLKVLSDSRLSAPHCILEPQLILQRDKYLNSKLSIKNLFKKFYK